HGKRIVQRMSDTLGAAQAFSMTSHETREQIRGDQVQQVALTRQTVVQRPNRLYFKASGDVSNEGWYDGTGLTVVAHNEKVFAQARMPETLDGMLDAVNERYGMTLPVSDLAYSSP